MNNAIKYPTNVQKGTILTRNDGELFRVVSISHWVEIVSESGRPGDYVKWYGRDIDAEGNQGPEMYASATTGFGYKLLVQG